MSIDNEDKEAWCDYGDKLEAEFLKGKYPVTWNPDKHSNPYVHDFVIHLPCDLKSVQTKWKFSEEMFGIPPDKAISINEKDLKRYRENYPNLVIIIDVNWDDVYLLSVQRAIELIKEKKAQRHEYLYRKNDTHGNAKVSWIFNTSDLEKMSGEMSYPTPQP